MEKKKIVTLGSSQRQSPLQTFVQFLCWDFCNSCLAKARKLRYIYGFLAERPALLYWHLEVSPQELSYRIILIYLVSQHSIWIAVCGRVFEGCATDNILQLALNSIYVHAPHQEEIPRIFGISLALYMFGQALSPTIAGIFANYTMSFLLAVGIFVFCAIYLFALVPLEDARESTVKSPDEDEEVATDTKASHRHILSRACLALVKSFSHPLRIFLATPILWGPGLALFSYLAAISYIYPALMVFSTMRFKFTGKENGWLISTAAISSSLYLLIVLFVLPRLFPQKDEMKRKLSREGAAFGSNYWSSLASMSLIALVIPTVGSSSRSWQLFLIVGTASMGLSTPAFLKSYAVALVKDSTEALTALALMETCGALLSPAILGTIQSRFREDLVFIVSAGMIAAAMLLLTVGAFYYALPLSLPRMGRGNRFN